MVDESWKKTQANRWRVGWGRGRDFIWGSQERPLRGGELLAESFVLWILYPGSYPREERSSRQRGVLRQEHVQWAEGGAGQPVWLEWNDEGVRSERWSRAWLGRTLGPLTADVIGRGMEAEGWHKVTSIAEGSLMTNVEKGKGTSRREGRGKLGFCCSAETASERNSTFCRWVGTY